MSSVCQILKDARNSKGLSLDAAAAALGVTKETYHDLELYDDELTKVLSLAEVKRLTEVLEVKWQDLVSCSDRSEAVLPIAQADVVRLVRDHMGSSGRTVADVEDEVGWEFVNDLESAERMRSRPVMFFQDLATVLHVDWMSLVATYLSQ